MGDQPLPAHRTRRISLTKSQLRTELGAELLSLCESVTADGKLAPDEAQDLREWLDDAVDAELPAASYLREVVTKVLADGEVTPDECREVYKAVEAVLPIEVRRQATAARREIESAEREKAKDVREAERVERKRNLQIASANFMVAGVRHEGRPTVIERYAETGAGVQLARDRGNRYSQYAIAVHLENGKQIGFVPEFDAERLAPLLDDGAKSDAYITKILSGGRSPIPVVQARLYSADATIEPRARSGASFYSDASGEFPATSRSGSSGHRYGLPVWVWVILFVVVMIIAFANSD